MDKRTGPTAWAAGLALALTLAGAAGCGGSGTGHGGTAGAGRPAAATVDGVTVAAGTLLGELQALRANTAALNQIQQQGPLSGSGPDGFSAAFVAQVLDSEVEQVVLAQAVAARRLTVPLAAARAIGAADVAGFAAYPAAYQTVLATRTADRIALAAALAHVSITGAALQSYLSSHRTDFTTYCLDGLALDTQAHATAARTALTAGGALAPLARSRSIDPNTRDDGGRLGCSDAADFASFAGVLDALPVGTYSQPLLVGQSWWVVTVASRTVESLPQATPDILGDLVTDYDPFNAWLQRGLASATVTVSPRYGRWDRAAQPPAVVSP